MSIAAPMAVRFWVDQRPRLLTPGGTTLAPVPDSNTPIAISRPRAARRMHRGVQIRDPAAARPRRRCVGRRTIMASGAAIGIQVSFAVAWVNGMFAVVEIILVSYLAMPGKTQAALRLLHDSALANCRRILVGTFVVVGVALVAHRTNGI